MDKHGTTNSGSLSAATTGDRSTERVAKYTPGPWSYQPAVDQPDGFWVGNDVENAAYVPGYIDHPGNVANARLIAAAPDMLATLTLVEHEMSELASRKSTKYAPLYHALNDVRAAIAKATGATLRSPVAKPPSNEEVMVP